MIGYQGLGDTVSQETCSERFSLAILHREPDGTLEALTADPLPQSTAIDRGLGTAGVVAVGIARAE